MPRAGASRRRKSRTQKSEDGQAPEAMTMVFKYGEVSSHLNQLVRDIRCILAPNTYSHLRESKRTKIRDYVKAGKELGAASVMAITKSDNSSFLKLGRLGDGPTSIFRLREFSLAHDVRSAAKRPRGLTDRDLLTPPALVLSGFEEAGKLAEIASILKAQFEQLVPTLDVAKANAKLIRRVLLVSLEPDERKSFRLRIRHFAISIRNTSVSRAVDKLLKSKSVPSGKKIGKMADAADILDAISESELENETMEITGSNMRLHSIPKTASLGVKLVELGPRIDADLIRVVDGVFDGQVVFEAASVEAAKVEKPSDALDALETELRTMREAEAEGEKTAKLQKRENLKTATFQRKIKDFVNKGESNDVVATSVRPTEPVVDRIVSFDDQKSEGKFRRPIPGKSKTQSKASSKGKGKSGVLGKFRSSIAKNKK